MTNTEKQELRRLVLQGKSFAEIRRVVGCSDATIRQYIKVFSGKDVNQTPTNPEWTELDKLLHYVQTAPGKELARIEVKKLILQWHTTLMKQAVLEARIDEIHLATVGKPAKHEANNEAYKTGFGYAANNLQKHKSHRLQTVGTHPKSITATTECLKLLQRLAEQSVNKTDELGHRFELVPIMAIDAEISRYEALLKSQQAGKETV